MLSSKEALKELEVVLSTNYGTKRYADIFKENLLKPIEKDLEVLEHLKLLFNGYNILEKMGIPYKDMYLLCKNGDDGLINDDDLIKEWLEK